MLLMITERLEYLVAWPITIENLRWAKAYEDRNQGYSVANSYVVKC